MAENNRIGIQTTRPPQFIVDLANRGLRAMNAANAGVVRDANVRDPNAAAGLRDPNAARGVRDPNTAQGARDPNAPAGAANGAAPVRLREGPTPNEQRVVNEAAFGRTREDYQRDIDANPSLIEALKVANFHPTADGLVRVEQAINKNQASWGGVVEAANAVVATGGKSANANKALGTAMKNFAQAAGLRKTDTADLAYMLARIMMKSDETERDDAMKRLTAALQAAQARLDKLTEDRNKLGPAEQQQPVQPPAQSDGGKKDDGGSQPNNTATAADEVARRNTERAQLDAQINNTKGLIEDLQQQIQQAQAGGQGQGQGNQDLVTEAIIAMVEQANAMAALFNADQVEGTAPPVNGQNGQGGQNGGTNNQRGNGATP